MIDTRQLDTLVDPLIDISRRAGAAIMKIYDADNADIEIKQDSSPVTSADLAANAVICESLQMLTPTVPIVSEENKHQPYATRSTYEEHWIVDPLDGTKEFIKRNGEFTVNIALIRGGKPVLGFVYVPVSGDLYYGGVDIGAYRINKYGEKTRIGATAIQLSQPGLRVVTSRSHMSDETEQWIAQLTHAEVQRKGSSLKITSIAAGEADLYPKIGPTMEWDTAAADAVLRAAGGSITQLSNGKPLDYNKPDLTNPHFLAAGQLN